MAHHHPISVGTGRFELSHGRMPRGFGTWAFDIDGETVFFSGLYRDAKKAAIRAAMTACAHDVYVLP